MHGRNIIIKVANQNDKNISGNLKELVITQSSPDDKKKKDQL